MLTDTTFRWFFTEADTQADHQRFWRQLALWAGGMDQKPREEFRIELSRTEVGVGDHLSIQAHLASPGGEPVREAKVVIVVERPDGESSELQGLFSRQEGCFEADYVPPMAGEYAVRARALRGGKTVGTDAAFFQASSVDRELEDPVANLSLLRRIAAATAEAGGRYCFYSELDRLLRSLSERASPLRIATTQRQDIWDSRALFAGFALALTLEWCVRRWKGLT